MRKINDVKLPREFVSEYHKNIALRIIGSAVIMLASAYLCTVLNLADVKYPVMAVLMVLAIGLVLCFLIFKLHLILFNPSWMGVITAINAGYKTKTSERSFSKRMIVSVTIDRGGKKPYTAELFRPESNVKSFGNAMNSTGKYYSKNVYQVYAPYKVGDTVIYLRGMKIFARFDVKNPEELLDPLFVCPYCGEINKLERESCYSCGKFLLK